MTAPRALHSKGMVAPARNRPARRSRAVFYPETDNMGEHELQRLIMEVLRPLVEAWLRAQGRVAHAGADTFMYYVEGDPTQRLAPDVYVLEGVPQERVVSSWKLWELDAGPAFALEVVSGDVLKDYEDAPALHGHIGTQELILFDPEATPASKRRHRWTVYRRGPAGFRFVEETHGDRVRSDVLGCFLRAVGDGTEMRARLAIDPRGDELVPTAREECARAEAERARAEAEIARLRDELEELRAHGRR